MNIGEKIKHLRLRHQLTQEELADRLELSKSFISQIERNRTSPSIQTLEEITQTFGLSLKDFFEEEEPQVSFSKDDSFEKYEKDHKMHIRWLIPNAQQRDMEPILVTLEPNGITYEDTAHTGQEFGYVLEGTLELQLGTQCFTLTKGEAFYYDATTSHLLRNPSTSEAKFLWISTPPSF